MMTSPVQLILKKEQVSVFAPVKPRMPDAAVVYVAADGRVEVFESGKPERWSTRRSSRFRWRYEVDTGDHRRTVELRSSPLPAKGGAYHFDAEIDVGFRVVDPAAVVRRDVDNGLDVVYNFLINECRVITRRFDFAGFAAAEDAVNERFAAGATLDEGIRIYHCVARLSAPGHAQFVRDQDDVWRGDALGARRHDAAINAAKRANQLALIRQNGEIVLRRAERDELGTGELNVHELIRQHLSRFPKDMATVISLFKELEQSRFERRELQEQRATDLFQFMAERNMIHAVDIAPFRDQVVGRLQDTAEPTPEISAAAAVGPAAPSSPKPVAAADLWSAPLPSAAAAERELGAPREVDPPDAGAAASGVVPVYLLLDRSVAVGECIEELNTGVDGLFDALIAHPDIAQIIRLSIIAYGEDASLRVDLAPISDGTHRLRISSAGQPRYSVAFEQLLDCIPRDVTALKETCSTVRRPQVLFLAAGTPADEASWGPVYQRLVDRQRMRYAPEIIALGIGTTTPATVLRIATARELAFLAENGNLASAVTQFFSFAEKHMLGYGRAAMDGYAGPLVDTPAGYRPADSNDSREGVAQHG